MAFFLGPIRDLIPQLLWKNFLGLSKYGCCPARPEIFEGLSWNYLLYWLPSFVIAIFYLLTFLLRWFWVCGKQIYQHLRERQSSNKIDSAIFVYCVCGHCHWCSVLYCRQIIVSIDHTSQCTDHSLCLFTESRWNSLFMLKLCDKTAREDDQLFPIF